MIPAETLALLTARCSTLEERLAPYFVADDADPHQRAEARLQRWAELGAKGDRDRLRHTLAWRGIDLDRMRPALGNISLAPESPHATWTLHFAELLETALIEHRRGEQQSHRAGCVIQPREGTRRHLRSHALRQPESGRDRRTLACDDRGGPTRGPLSRGDAAGDAGRAAAPDPPSGEHLRAPQRIGVPYAYAGRHPCLGHRTWVVVQCPIAVLPRPSQTG